MKHLVVILMLLLLPTLAYSATDRTVAIYPSTASSPSGYAATYTSMDAMESAEDGDLTSLNRRLLVEITASDGSWSGAPDSGTVIFDGWKCNKASDQYVYIYTKTGDSARPDNAAFWDTGAYILDMTNAITLRLDNDFDIGTSYLDIVFDGIQIQNSSGGHRGTTIYSSASHGYFEFRKCWFEENDATDAIYNGTSGFSDKMLIVNSVMNGDFSTSQSGLESDSGDVYVVNCTIAGFAMTNGGLDNDAADMYPINCAFFYNGDDLNDTDQAFPTGYSLRCATDEGAGEDTYGVDITPTVDPGPDRDGDLHSIFEDPDGGDYRVKGVGEADIIGEGATQNEIYSALGFYLVPDDDMVGYIRPQDDSRPTIGAFEYQIPPAGGATQMILIISQ